MKFILAKGNKKREIEAPFGLCASREDMESLRNQINEWLDDPGNGCGIVYGFLFVNEIKYEMGPSNTVPEPWE